MLFYHIDKHRALSKTGAILPFSNKPHPWGSIFTELSSHGINYFVSQNKLTHSCVYEMVLEYVRAVKYPQYPSRFHCFFASRDLRPAMFWARTTQDPFNLVTIEASAWNEFDCSWFTLQKDTIVKIPNNCDLNSMAALAELANKYWQKLRTNTPILELMIPLPCEIVKIETFSTAEECLSSYNLIGNTSLE